MQSNIFLLMSANTATLLVQIVVVKDLGCCVLVSDDSFVKMAMSVLFLLYFYLDSNILISERFFWWKEELVWLCVLF